MTSCKRRRTVSDGVRIGAGGAAGRTCTTIGADSASGAVAGVAVKSEAVKDDDDD